MRPLHHRPHTGGAPDGHNAQHPTALPGAVNQPVGSGSNPTPPAPLAPLTFDDVVVGTAESGWAVGGRSLNDTVLLVSHTADGSPGRLL